MRRSFRTAALLIAFSASHELRAVPVRFEAVLETEDGSFNRTAALHLTSQGLKAQSISATIPIPGQVTVDIPAGTTWQVRTESADLWSSPRWIAPNPDGSERTELLRFFPAATIRGTLTSQQEVGPLSTVDLRLGAAPEASSPKPSLTLVECPVEQMRFRCRVPAGRLDLRLRAEKFIPFYLWDVEVPGGQDLDLGAFPLKVGSSVVGWVQTEDSKPAAAAVVRLEPQTLGLPADRGQLQSLMEVALETRTNARGFFQLTEAAPGMFVVTAKQTDLVSASRPGIEVRPDLEAQVLDPLVLAKPLTARLMIDPPTAPSGHPWVLQFSIKPDIEGLQGQVFRGETSSDGIWQGNGLSKGTYTLVLADGDLRWSFEDLEVSPNHTELQVRAPGVRIQGTVRLGKEPLQATLWFGGRSAARRARFVSDQEGRFEGLLPEEGIWAVELVSEAEGLRLKLDMIEVQKLPGAEHAKVEVRIPNTKVRGRVVDERGQPVAQASILMASFGRPGSKAESDSEGNFEVRGLPAGDIVLRAEKGEGESEWQQAHLAEDQESPELRLVLLARVAIHGQVLSSHGPVPGAQILATAELGPARAASGDTAVSGASGEFKLRLPASTHMMHLSVLAPGYATRMMLIPLSSQPLLISLEPTGGTLIFDFGDLTRHELLRLGAGLLFHGGSFVPLGGTLRWAQLQRTPQPDTHKLVLANMEAGEYLLCVGGASFGPAGPEPQPSQCSRGYLNPLQELVLTLPPLPKEHLERLRPSL